MYTPEEPSDVDGEFSKRQIIAGIGLTLSGGGIFAYREGITEDYENLTLESQDEEALKYSFDGQDYFVELQDLIDDPLGNFVEISLYSGSLEENNRDITETFDEGDKIDNSEVTPPEVIVDSVNYSREEKHGDVDLRVRSDLSPEILETGNR
jgi:hypothetical protein